MEDKTIVLKLELQLAQAKANVKSLEKTIEGMDKRTLEAKAKMAQLAVEVEKVGNLKGKINLLSKEVGGISKSMSGASAATGSASASVLELGRTISDSNYGIRGMANNLSQLASNLVYTSRAAGGVAAGFKAVWSAMMGPLGILLAFQAVIAIIEKMSMAQDEMKRKTKEATDEIKIQITALEKLGSLTGALFQNLDIVEKFNAGALSLSETINILSKRYSDFAAGYSKLTEEQKKDPEVLRKVINAYGDLLNTREKLDKKQKEAVILQRQLNEEGEFLISNGLKTVNPVANTLASVNSEIIKLLKQENSLREFFTVIKEGKGKKEKVKKQAKIDFDPFGEFAPQSYYLKNFEQWYADYSEKRNALMSELGDPMDLDTESFGAKRNIIDTLEQTDLNSIQEQIEIRKSLNLEYEDLEAEQTLIRKEAQIARNEIDRLEMENKRQMYDNIASILQSASGVAGKETAVGKAIAVAGTTISTWSAAQKAYESQMTLTPDSPIRAQIAWAAAAAKGLANIKAILAVKVPNSGGAGGGATRSLPQQREFDFNLVGSTGTNQLASSIQGKFNEPLKAYVVSTEMSTQQQLDSRIKSTAVLGDDD